MTNCIGPAHITKYSLLALAKEVIITSSKEAEDIFLKLGLNLSEIYSQPELRLVAKTNQLLKSYSNEFIRDTIESQKRHKKILKKEKYSLQNHLHSI